MHDYQWALCDILLQIAEGQHSEIVEAACDLYDNARPEDLRKFAKDTSDYVVEDWTEGKQARQLIDVTI